MAGAKGQSGGSRVDAGRKKKPLAERIASGAEAKTVQFL